MITFKSSGLDALLKQFDKLAKDVQNDVQSEINSFGDDVVRDAKILVKTNSKNLGGLQNSIDKEFVNGGVIISARSKYAAYIEFGTRKFATEEVSKLPSDWQAYAQTFKGPMVGGGNFTEFVEAIMEWMRNKGIQGGTYNVKTKRRKGNKKKKESEDKQVAYAIAQKIMRDGIKARPFMYPSINKNLPLLIERLKDIIK